MDRGMKGIKKLDSLILKLDSQLEKIVDSL